jgi:hypothetical protein
VTPLRLSTIPRHYVRVKATIPPVSFSKDSHSAVTRMVHWIEHEPPEARWSDGGRGMFDKNTSRRAIEERNRLE